MHICLATQRWPVRRLSHENVGRKFAPGIIGIGMYIIGAGLLSPTVLPGSLTSPSQNKSSLPTITFQRQAVKLRGCIIWLSLGGASTILIHGRAASVSKLMVPRRWPSINTVRRRRFEPKRQPCTLSVGVVDMGSCLTKAGYFFGGNVALGAWAR